VAMTPEVGLRAHEIADFKLAFASPSTGV